MAERGVNKSILLGSLGNDPIVRYSPNGTAFANFSVATSETWKDKNTGEKRERTDWHNIVIQGKLAEVAGQYLKKGSQVYIEGKMRTRKYQGNDGQDKYITEVIVGIDGKMQMLGGRGGESSGQSQGGQSGWGQPQQMQQQSADWSKQSPDGEWEDDIPFAPIGLPYPRHAIYVI